MIYESNPPFNDFFGFRTNSFFEQKSCTIVFGEARLQGIGNWQIVAGANRCCATARYFVDSLGMRFMSRASLANVVDNWYWHLSQQT